MFLFALPSERNKQDFESSVIADVLTVIPTAPVARILEITGLLQSNDAHACADIVCQHLLEEDATDDLEIPRPGLNNPPPGIDIFDAFKVKTVDNVPGADQPVISKPELVQSRKRHAEDELNPFEDDTPDSSDSIPPNSAGQSAIYECNCCYIEVPFEDMIQCAEGHLFCKECLRRYAQEAVYGQIKTNMTCMTDGCDANFPTSQLLRALPEALYRQYDERIADEALNLAELPNLLRCPFCNYQGILNEDQHIFVCPNELCQKRSCRKCRVLWEEHEGLLCNEIEKEVETKLRLDFEEKMAEARIRICSACKAKFTKETGCNRITCRCGQLLCYVCRAPINGYDHFCQHLRSPGKPCNQCQKCFLWSNADIEDNLAITEIKQQANQVRLTQGFEVSREIGAPTSPKAERRAAVNVQLARPRRPYRRRPNWRIAAAAAVHDVPVAVHVAAAAQNPALIPQEPVLPMLPVVLRADPQARVCVRRPRIPPRQPRQRRGAAARQLLPQNPPQGLLVAGRHNPIPAHVAQPNLPPPLNDPRILLGQAPVPFARGAAGPEIGNAHKVPDLFDAVPRNERPLPTGGQQPLENDFAHAPLFSPANPIVQLNRLAPAVWPMNITATGYNNNNLPPVPATIASSSATAQGIRPLNTTAAVSNNNPAVPLNRIPVTATIASHNTTAQANRPLTTTVTGFNNTNPTVQVNRLPATAISANSSATVQANRPLNTTTTGFNCNPIVQANQITETANRPLAITVTASNNADPVVQANRLPATATSANSVTAQANGVLNATAAGSNNNPTLPLNRF